MDEAGPTAKCLAGDMPLSVDLDRRMRRWAEHPDEREENARPATTFRWGGHWFCPADGAPTREIDGSVRCVSCRGPLDGFLYALIELHPHRPSDAAVRSA